MWHNVKWGNSIEGKMGWIYLWRSILVSILLHFHGIIFETLLLTLTDDIFETGAYRVPSKSQNSTVLGQGGLSSTQCSNPSRACRWHHPFGTNNYPPFRHSTQNQVQGVLCLRGFLRLWKNNHVSRKPCKRRSDIVLNG